jgi:hypothetical protein
LDLLRRSRWIGDRIARRYIGALISDEYQDTGDDHDELLCSVDLSSLIRTDEGRDRSRGQGERYVSGGPRTASAVTTPEAFDT